MGTRSQAGPSGDQLLTVTLMNDRSVLLTVVHAVAFLGQAGVAASCCRLAVTVFEVKAGAVDA